MPALRLFASNLVVSNLVVPKLLIPKGDCIWYLTVLGLQICCHEPYRDVGISHKMLPSVFLCGNCTLIVLIFAFTYRYEVMTVCWSSKAHDRPSFDDLSQKLQILHDQNTDLLQLEKYPVGSYQYLLSPTDQDEVV